LILNYRYMWCYSGGTRMKCTGDLPIFFNLWFYHYFKCKH
jgi:hypothetical protein